MFNHVMEYMDVADAWARAVAGEHAPSQKRAGARLVRGWEAPGAARSYGGTIADMRGWIDNGFEAPGMKIKSGQNARPRCRTRFAEEGELQVDLAMQGHDLPFLSRQPRRRTPGLKLQIGYNAASSTPATMLADYGAWVAALIAGLQDRGFDLEIGIFSTARMMSSGKVVRSIVRVKRFGRKSSLKSWGALFSPAGYRMLGFTARMLACSHHGFACDDNMGVSMAPGWGVRFDPKTRTLTLNIDPHAQTFPRETMDAALAEYKL